MKLSQKRNNHQKAYLALSLALSLSFAPSGISADSSSSPMSLKPYGFLKSSVVTSSNLVSSVGRMNLTAPTYALPRINYGQDIPLSTFQTSQSRVGFYLLNSQYEQVKGQFEFDMMGGYHATATTNLYPRVRVLKISYKLSDVYELEMGNDVDLFSPLKPFSYNFVGNYVFAGALGSLRPQVKLNSLMGNSTFVFALGMARLNNNNSVSPTDEKITGGIVTSVERTWVPSISAKWEETLSPEMAVGFSVMAGRHRFENVSSIAYSTSTTDYAAATGLAKVRGFYGLNPYFKWNENQEFQLNASLYYGQDLGYAGDTFALSKNASPFGALHEVGGFLSTRYMMASDWGFLGGFGVAKVLDKAGGGSISDMDFKSGFLLARNSKANLGVFYTLVGKLNFFAEYSYFNTQFYDKVNKNHRIETAHVADLGLHYPF